MYRDQPYATINELEELRREVDRLRLLVEPPKPSPVGCTGPQGFSYSSGMSGFSMSAKKLSPQHKRFGTDCPKCKTTTVWLTRVRATEPDEHFKVRCHSITTNTGCGYEWTEYPADHKL